MVLNGLAELMRMFRLAPSLPTCVCQIGPTAAHNSVMRGSRKGKEQYSLGSQASHLAILYHIHVSYLFSFRPFNCITSESQTL
ncbi:hypothetical protein BGZ63DRAFT_383521 [Mariannaea sp. PMI_226]|nr:hypothetical protein BGZ63DRAFT_383521 [Mariannaea sp. PMI_226]